VIPGLFGGPSLGLGSSASATGGTAGAFNFSPKAGINPWIVAGVVVVVALLLVKRK
jgi:hypothetical protein